MDFKLKQYWKALWPIVANDGVLTESKAVQDLNAPCATLMHCGKLIEVRCWQYAKALTPIFTHLDKVTCDKLEQLVKVESNKLII